MNPIHTPQARTAAQARGLRRRHSLQQLFMLTAAAATGAGLGAGLLAPTAAHAHGPAAHGHGHGNQPVRREQKPWGIAGEPGAVSRTIDVRMDDRMRFTPDHITVREGDTVRIRASNRGRLMHEIVIGDQKELDAHAELMKKHPNMEHDEPYMAHVAPGRRGDIVWQFNRAGDFRFACLIAGHYDAGMIGRITVTPR